MKINEEGGTTRTWMAPVLNKLGVTSFTASLSGGGDSGQLDDLFFYKGEELVDDAVRDILQKLTTTGIPGQSESFMTRLEGMIEKDACDMGNWYDNDGGSVYLEYTVHPTELEITEGHIHFFEPEDDEYDLDDEDIEDEDIDDDDVDNDGPEDDRIEP